MRERGRWRRGLAALLLGAAAAACRTITPLPADGAIREPRAARAPAAAAPAEPVARQGHAIVVAGERFPCDAPVVLWSEPPYYDASSTRPRFSGERRGERFDRERRASDPALARRVAASGWTLGALREAVDLFVLHYDACGTSRRCFEVLHDRRGLSVHFLLDVDGTLYQTMDLASQAWHAGGDANPRSIGVEIAHAGAFPPAEHARRTAEAYARDARGARLVLSAADGVRTPGFEGRPARPTPVRGRVQGEELEQWDFTPEQYASLEALAASLCELFPRIAPEAPRDARGAVRADALGAEELARFHGILGHWHVGAHKVDPGPAFDWEGFLRRVRARVVAP